MYAVNLDLVCRPRLLSVKKKHTLCWTRAAETGCAPAVSCRAGEQQRRPASTDNSLALLSHRSVCIHVWKCVGLCVLEWAVWDENKWGVCLLPHLTDNWWKKMYIMQNRNVCHLKSDGSYEGSVGAIKMVVDPDKHTQWHAKPKCSIVLCSTRDCRESQNAR